MSNAESGPRVIRVVIERNDPLTGSVLAEQGEEVRFDGWLGLLTALSLLIPFDHSPPAPRNDTAEDRS